ncbi:MAG: hypothetical protein OEY07_01820, partial [Gammaproteobacteria bacterium]|nr:hypothetical protein [Gammaproteobacteria bacterium]
IVPVTTVQLGDTTFFDAVVDPNLNVHNVETITASGFGNTIIGASDQSYTWSVNASASGVVSPTTGSTAENTVTFTSFDTLTGGSDVDTFDISADKNWTLNGGDNNDVYNISSNYFGSLNGQNGDDVFTVGTGVSFIGLINGGNNGGNGDLLQGADQTNFWQISSPGGGLLNANVSFVGIERLTGGTNDDTFTYVGAGDISGLVDGGGHIVLDRVDMSSMGTVSITLDSIKFTNIELFNGNNVSSTLTADNFVNNWSIDGENDGSINGIRFVDFNNLVGGANDDMFTFIGSGNITGSVNGSGQAVRDIVDMQNLATANVTLGAAGYSNIERFIGNNTDSTLTGENIVNDWQISGTNDGTVNGIEFFDFNNLTGGTNPDIFTMLATGRINGLIDGGDTIAGNNELIGRDSNSTWTIDALNGGSVRTVSTIYVNRFDRIQNLTGGSGNDTFNYSGAGSTAGGVVDGGNHTVRDSVDMSTLGTASVNLGTGFTNIERFTGNNVSSTLTAGDTTNTWLITDENDGSVNGIDFIDFNNLIGGSDDDMFTYSDPGNITGLVNGGGHLFGDEVNMVNLAVANVILGTRFTNIELFTGNNVDSTITGADVVNGWTIDNENDGSVNSIQFLDFNKLVGGANDDTFTFTSTGSITGSVDGGAHNNRDSVDMSALTTVSITLGSSGFNNIERYTGNNSDSTLTGENIPNTWNITDLNDGTVNGIEFFDFNNLIGGTEDDLFVYTGAGSIATLVDGGGEAFQDRVDMSLLPAVTLGIGVGFINIERFIGNNSDSTLIGQDVATDWNIFGENDVTVNGIQYVDFNNLTGGLEDDTFFYTGTGSTTGLVNGGAHGVRDSVNMSGLGVVNVSLGNGFANIERFTGNNSDSTLFAGDAANSWLINGVNDGIVNSIEFFNFNILNGGAADDTFTYTGTGSIATMVNGGGQTVRDVVDMSALGSVSVTVNNGFGNIERFIGNDSDSTLRGADTVNSWNITGINDGNINGIEFVNFNNLTGGSARDTFTFAADTNLAGLLDGGGAPLNTDGDIVNLVALAGPVSVSLNTVLSPESINMINVENINGNNDPGSVLIAGSAQNHTWDINGFAGNNSGQIDLLINFSGFANLVGGNATDNFIFRNTGWINGLVDGGTGNDTVDITQLTGNRTVQLGSPDAMNPDAIVLNPAVLNVDYVENINANAAFNNTLRGDNYANVWNNTTGRDGNVTRTIPAPLEISFTAFTGFANLVGGLNIDEFNITGSLNSVSTGRGLNLVVVGDGSTGGTVTTITGGIDADEFTINTNSTVGSINGDGGNDTFRLMNGSVLTGQIDGGDGNDTVDFSDQAVVDITLGSNIAGVTQVETVIGNNTNSTLRGPSGPLAGDTFWTISAGNSGQVVGDADITDGQPDSLNFVGFNILEGGSTVDTFTINAIYTGTIRGNGNNDQFFINAGVNTIDGGFGNDAYFINANISTILDAFGDDTFYINTNLTGTINGGFGDDTFNISTTMSGTLNGDGGNDRFIFISPGVTVGAINGGLDTDTIIAANQPNVWNISSDNTGTLNGNNIIGVEQLTGNDAVDTYILNANITGYANGMGGNDVYTINAAITGSLDGGPANDTFNFVSGSAERVTGNSGDDILNVSVNPGVGLNKIIFDGGSGINLVTITGGSDQFSATYNIGVPEGAFLYDQLLYVSSSNQYNILYRQITDVVDTAAAANYQINGTNSNDTIVMNYAAPEPAMGRPVQEFNSIRVGANPAIYFENKTGLSVDGGAGANDMLILDSNINLPATDLSINMESIDSTNNVVDFQINASSISFNNTVSIDSMGGRLLTETGAVTINNTGAIYLQNLSTSELTIVDLATSGLVDIITGGNVIGSDLTHGNTLNLTSGGDITLTGSNTLSGALTLIGNNVLLDNHINTSLSGDMNSLTVDLFGNNLTANGNFADITVNQGNVVSITSANDLGINTIVANSVSLYSTNGGILDLNLDQVNVITASLTIESAAGVGTPGDLFETETAALNVFNSGNNNSSVNIINQGPVTLNRLINTGDINYINENGDVRLGLLDAGFDSGDLNMTVRYGSIIGDPGSPDLQARNAEVRVPNGDFGSEGRYIRVQVRDRFLLFANNSFVLYLNVPSQIEDLSSFSRSAFAFGVLDSESMIEIESLSEIDPAIFTSVSNYYYAELAIMLPDEQSATASDEEEKKRRQREKMEELNNLHQNN